LQRLTSIVEDLHTLDDAARLLRDVRLAGVPQVHPLDHLAVRLRYWLTPLASDSAACEDLVALTTGSTSSSLTPLTNLSVTAAFALTDRGFAGLESSAASTLPAQWNNFARYKDNGVAVAEFTMQQLPSNRQLLWLALTPAGALALLGRGVQLPPEALPTTGFACGRGLCLYDSAEAALQAARLPSQEVKQVVLVLVEVACGRQLHSVS
jgi:hypothetical protein